jgi:hypothetical protein
MMRFSYYRLEPPGSVTSKSGSSVEIVETDEECPGLSVILLWLDGGPSRGVAILQTALACGNTVARLVMSQIVT